MKIVYFTYPHFFDPALHYMGALSKKEKVYLFIAVGEDGWQNAMFDISSLNLPLGVHKAKELITSKFPLFLQEYFSQLEEIYVIRYGNKSLNAESYKITSAAYKEIINLEPDIIHFDYYTLRSILGLWKLKRFKIVANIHDPIPHSGENNWRRKLIDLIGLRYTKHFILFNKNQLNYFSEFYHIGLDRISHIKLGTYLLLNNYGTEKKGNKGNTVLFFGRITKYKGLNILFRSIEILDKKGYKINFIIAGQPDAAYSIPPSPSLKNCSLITKYHYINNSDLAELIDTSKIVVCPYLNATQSGVILSSYAFNKPVIGTDTGGFKEYIWCDETGIIVPPNDEIRLAKAIENLLFDEIKLSNMKESIAKKNKNELNWNILINEYLEVYNKI